MSNTRNRIIAGVMGVAALGALTVGIAGSAHAATSDATPPPTVSGDAILPNVHPITGRTAVFTVENYTHQPVKFVGYEDDTQPADPGPHVGLLVGPEQSTTFAVDTWTLGGVHTGALFTSLDGKSNWTVDMRSNAIDNEVACKTNAVCSANGWQPDTTVALYPIVGPHQQTS